MEKVSNQFETKRNEEVARATSLRRTRPSLNPLMPNRYNCTYVLFLFLWSISLQIKPLEFNSKLNWRIFIFAPNGT